MADVSRSENWKRWAGSLDDIASLGKRAVELVGADDEGKEHCQIEVVLPGLDTAYDGPDEFINDVHETDRTRIERISLRVGSYRQAQRVVVAFDDDRGTSLTVGGDDRQQVEGTTRLLKERLDEGGGRRISADAAGLGATGTVLLALLLVAAAMPGEQRAQEVDFSIPTSSSWSGWAC